MLNLLSNMRPLAFQGCHAAVPSDFFKEVRQLPERSKDTFAGYAGDQLLCVFGVVVGGTLLAPLGLPWMLTTNNLDSHAVPFARRSKQAIGAMLDEYHALFMQIDARDVLLVKWLRWLGFKADAPQPHGPHGLPFYSFYKGRN